MNTKTRRPCRTFRTFEQNGGVTKKELFRGETDLKRFFKKHYIWHTKITKTSKPNKKKKTREKKRRRSLKGDRERDGLHAITAADEPSQSRREEGSESLEGVKREGEYQGTRPWERRGEETRFTKRRINGRSLELSKTCDAAKGGEGWGLDIRKNRRKGEIKGKVCLPE